MFRYLINVTDYFEIIILGIIISGKKN